MRSILMTTALVSALAGCGTLPPTQASGDFVTTQHGEARFKDALQGAADYCAGRGKGMRHLGTDNASISRFECVAR